MFALALAGACRSVGSMQTVRDTTSRLADSSFAIAGLSTVSVDAGIDAKPDQDGQLFGLTRGEQAFLSDALRGLLERRLREQRLSVINGALDSVRLFLRVRPLSQALGQALAVTWTVDLAVSRPVRLLDEETGPFRASVWRRSRSGTEIRGLSQMQTAVQPAAQEIIDGLVSDLRLVADTLRNRRGSNPARPGVVP